MFFTLYNKADGKISATGFAPKGEVIEPRDDSEAVILRRADLKTQYVKNSAIADRPPMPVRLIGSNLIGIPFPAEIRINGASYPCSEPIAALEFTYPGKYSVVVSSWPYLDAEFEVVA